MRRVYLTEGEVKMINRIAIIVCCVVLAFAGTANSQNSKGRTGGHSEVREKSQYLQKKKCAKKDEMNPNSMVSGLMTTKVPSITKGFLSSVTQDELGDNIESTLKLPIGSRKLAHLKLKLHSEMQGRVRARVDFHISPDRAFSREEDPVIGSARVRLVGFKNRWAQLKHLSFEDNPAGIYYIFYVVYHGSDSDTSNVEVLGQYQRVQIGDIDTEVSTEELPVEEAEVEVVEEFLPVEEVVELEIATTAAIPEEEVATTSEEGGGFIEADCAVKGQSTGNEFKDVLVPGELVHKIITEYEVKAHLSKLVPISVWKPGHYVFRAKKKTGDIIIDLTFVID